MSGGAHTSRTIMLADLRQLLHSCDASASIDEFKMAVIEHNALGKRSESARQRTFRYLRELYRLDIEQPSFGALRALWDRDATAQPLIGMLSALAHDSALRATAPPILTARDGERISAADLAASVVKEHPGDYNEAIAAKIGRNALSSWEQSGHLHAVARTAKVRTRAQCRPAAVAYALFLGYLEGGAGQGLLDTLYTRVLDVPNNVVRDQAFEAAQRGWIDYREVGGIVEVGFRELLENVPS